MSFDYQDPGTVSVSDDYITLSQGYDTDDSGFEDQSVLTESVRSSIYDYRYENGRRYHAYKEGAYFMPNDALEQDRLDMQHRAMFLAAGAKYLYAPVNNPQRILDVGTGTGIWAIEASEVYPDAQFTGIDLSPIQPTFVPPNVKFEVDDIESQWTWPTDHFDVIYSRFMLSGSIQDFRRYFEQAYKHTKPGGYFEIHDLFTDIRSDYYTFPPDHAVKQWCALMQQGIKMMKCHLDLDFVALADMMRDVGFVDVVLRPFKIPIGKWPADPRLNEAGALQQVAMLEGIESLSLAVFTRCLNWDPLEVQILLAKARKDFCIKKACTYWPCAVIYGKKPEPTYIEAPKL